MASLTVCSFLALVLLAFTGCHVGSADDTGDGSSPPDAAVGGDDDGDDTATDDGGDDDGGDVPEGCVDFATELPDGHHVERYEFMAIGSPGCISASCHGEPAGPAAPKFTVGGSLYDQYRSGGSPVAGARVWVTDSTGKSVEMITASNGFFYTEEPLTPPFTTFATGCPDRNPMMTPAPNGNCSFGQCHGENLKAYLGDP